MDNSNLINLFVHIFAMQRQKLTQEISNPTDSLTKTSILDSSSNRGMSELNYVYLSICCSFGIIKHVFIWQLTGKQNGSEDAKIIFKSPTVRLSVVKKPVLAKGNNSAKAEDKKQVGEQAKDLTKPDEKDQDGENKTNGASNVLQSLCQNYDSDDSDD